MDWVSILAVVGTVCSIVFGYLAFTRNKTHDERGEGQQTGTILTELGYVKSGVDDIKAETREQRKVNTELYSRMTAVESSAKLAHHRIDRLEHLDENDR